ncbi:MAG: hypothetical protein GXY53_11035 [Desulfobulbus sp.]|nr:hypothetical protein [Desulfobulbus sp.]
MISTHIIKEMRSPVASPLDALGRQRVFGRFLKDAEMCGWSGVQPDFFFYIQKAAKIFICQIGQFNEERRFTLIPQNTKKPMYTWAFVLLGLMRKTRDTSLFLCVPGPAFPVLMADLTEIPVDR